MSKTVDIRALQQHASKIVADAVAHGPVVITEGGRAVAMVVPLVGAGLEGLREQGLVTTARRRLADVPAPIAGAAPLTDSLE